MRPQIALTFLSLLTTSIATTFEEAIILPLPAILPEDVSISKLNISNTSTKTNSHSKESPSSPDDNHDVPQLELHRRAQGSCLTGYNSCSTLSAEYQNICCATTAVCSQDSNGNVACCPLGAFCTGTISPNLDSTVATTGSATAGVGTASVIATTTAGGNGVVIVVGGTSTAVGTATATGFSIASSEARRSLGRVGIVEGFSWQLPLAIVALFTTTIGMMVLL